LESEPERHEGPACAAVDFLFAGIDAEFGEHATQTPQLAFVAALHGIERIGLLRLDAIE